MCTVTYIKTKSKVIITSNRDENTSRPLAHEPRAEVLHNCRIYYPKDSKAGGTWFAVNEFGAVVVLLNGAFHKHKKAGPYLKSRGLVVLDAVCSLQPFEAIKTLPLIGIEPFTLILYQDQRLMVARWDGRRRYLRELDPDRPYIWSSSTLYQPSVIRFRELLFSRFIAAYPDPHEDQVISFQSDSNEDPENGFVVNRDTGLRTLSISQAVLEGGALFLKYTDLAKGVTHQLPLYIKGNHILHHEPSRP